MNIVQSDSKTIVFAVSSARIFRWQIWLAEALAAQGGKISFYPMAEEGNTSVSADLMLELERRIYKISGEQAFDVVANYSFPVRSSPTVSGKDLIDILINFTSTEIDEGLARRVITPLFDGRPGELGAIIALLAHRNVEICLEDSAQTAHCWIGRPAVEDKKVIGRGLNNIFSRAVELIVYAVRGRGTKSSLVPVSACKTREETPGELALAVSSALQLTGGLTKKVVNRLLRIAKSDIVEHWAIAWRRVEGRGLLDQGEGATATYQLIKDDGKRYFADPFVFEKDGQTYIFCEEYPYATEKGVISVFTLDDDGVLSDARLVLERPYHLSYPHLIESEGEIWMIPEAGAGGNIELYRAVSFPDKWELEKVLLEGVAGYDATLTRHDGKFWLFLSTSCHQSTSWDNLEIYSADSLQGEWVSHKNNPVLVDGYVSRPGGEMIELNGELLRPAQDGSEVYGGALAICRVDHLDERDFSQSLIGRVRVTAPSSAYGVHTINRVGNLEVIDVLGRMPSDCTKTRVVYEKEES